MRYLTKNPMQKNVDSGKAVEVSAILRIVRVQSLLISIVLNYLSD